jgi:hypothetical protein
MVLRRHKKGGVLLLLFFISITGNVNSQTITATKLSSFPEFFHAKIAWISNNNVCIMLDKESVNSKFHHTVFFYDTTGNLSEKSFRMKSDFSIQHNYSLVLNKTIYFFNRHADKYGTHEFYIDGLVSGMEYNSENNITIFKPKRNDEEPKLNTPKYKFDVVKGSYGQKALLTYNNDYTEQYAEGFWFRTLDEKGNMSDVDTLKLPYNDRLCNIADLIYDDKHGKVYILCELFSVVNKERHFLKSIVCVYDIAAKSCFEVTGNAPSFKELIIQKYQDNELTAFVGVGPGKTGKDSCLYSSILIQNNDRTILNNCSGNIAPASLVKFYETYNYKKSELLKPLKIVRDVNNNLQCMFCFFPTLDDIAREGNTKTGVGIGLSTALLGIATGIIIYTSPSSDLTTSEVSSLLWLKLGINNCSNSATGLTAPLNTNNYSKHSFSGLMINGNMHVIYNRVTEKTNKLTQPFFAIQSEQGLQNDTLFTRSLKAQNVNEIFPLSEYSNGESTYFIGHFNGASEPYGDDPKIKEGYYLLEIK